MKILGSFFPNLSPNGLSPTCIIVAGISKFTVSIVGLFNFFVSFFVSFFVFVCCFVSFFVFVCCFVSPVGIVILVVNLVTVFPFELIFVIPGLDISPTSSSTSFNVFSIGSSVFSSIKDNFWGNSVFFI